MIHNQDIGTATPADLAAGPGTPITLCIPASAEYVALSRLAIAALSNRFGLDQEVLSDLKLAVTEACSLFIEDVRAVAPDAGTITVEFDLSEDSWAITVAGVVGVDRMADLGRPEDMALVVIEALTDEMETRQDGTQGWLRFTKTVR
jgi:anti-sigma regulatory factor (Ser/Thr protein kinase)